MDKIYKPTKNPFFNFLQDYRSRSKNRCKSASESAADGARLWNRMTGRQREPYIEMAIPFKKRKQRSRNRLSPASRVATMRTTTTQSRTVSQPPQKKLKRTLNARTETTRNLNSRTREDGVTKMTKTARNTRTQSKPKVDATATGSRSRSRVFFAAGSRRMREQISDEVPEQMLEQNIYKTGGGGRHGSKGAKTTAKVPSGPAKKQKKKKTGKSKRGSTDSESPSTKKKGGTDGGKKTASQKGGSSRGSPSTSPAVVPEANAAPVSTTPIAAPDVGKKAGKGGKSTSPKSTAGSTTKTSDPSSTIQTPPGSTQPATSGTTPQGSSSSAQPSTSHSTGHPSSVGPGAQTNIPTHTTTCPTQPQCIEPTETCPTQPQCIQPTETCPPTTQTCPPPTETCPPQPECTEAPTCPPECTTSCPPPPDCSQPTPPPDCKSCRQPGHLFDPSTVDIDGDIVVGSTSMDVLETVPARKTSKKAKMSSRVKKIPPPGSYLPSNNDSEVSDSASPQL